MKKLEESYETNESIIEGLYELLQDRLGNNLKIADLFCGSGSFLFPFLKHARDIYLNDFNKVELDKAVKNLKSKQKILNLDFELHQSSENVLVMDLPVDCDLIVSTPPWGVKLYKDEMKNLKFKTFQGNIIYSMLQSIKINGIVAVVVPTNYLKEDLEFSRYIIDNKYLEKIISLPSGLFGYTSIKTDLLIFSKSKNEKVSFFNSNNDFEAIDKYKNKWNYKGIIDIYKNKEYSEVFYSSIDIKEIIDNNYNLSLFRYLRSDKMQGIEYTIKKFYEVAEVYTIREENKKKPTYKIKTKTSEIRQDYIDFFIETSLYKEQNNNNNFWRNLTVDQIKERDIAYPDIDIQDDLIKKYNILKRQQEQINKKIEEIEKLNNININELNTEQKKAEIEDQFIRFIPRYLKNIYIKCLEESNEKNKFDLWCLFFEGLASYLYSISYNEINEKIFESKLKSNLNSGVTFGYWVDNINWEDLGVFQKEKIKNFMSYAKNEMRNEIKGHGCLSTSNYSEYLNILDEKFNVDIKNILIKIFNENEIGRLIEEIKYKNKKEYIFKIITNNFYYLKKTNKCNIDNIYKNSLYNLRNNKKVSPYIYLEEDKDVFYSLKKIEILKNKYKIRFYNFSNAVINEEKLLTLEDIYNIDFEMYEKYLNIIISSKIDFKNQSGSFLSANDLIELEVKDYNKINIKYIIKDKNSILNNVPYEELKPFEIIKKSDCLIFIEELNGDFSEKNSINIIKESLKKSIEFIKYTKEKWKK